MYMEDHVWKYFDLPSFSPHKTSTQKCAKTKTNIEPQTTEDDDDADCFRTRLGAATILYMRKEVCRICEISFWCDAGVERI